MSGPSNLGHSTGPNATLYVCQGCGKQHVEPGLKPLPSYGPYCSNHDPDGSGEIYVATAHVAAQVQEHGDGGA